MNMEFKQLFEIEEFEQLEKWDVVLCEFFRNVWWSNWVRFWCFEILENKKQNDEIILEKNRNIYFNYRMFVNWDINSNLREIHLVYNINK